MYLINGEILNHESAPGKYPRGNIFEFLKHNNLDIEPPPGEKGLTFINHCRFPNVELSKVGIGTQGIIWKLYRRIDPSYFSADLDKKTKTKYFPRELSNKIDRHRFRRASRHRLNYREHKAL